MNNTDLPPPIATHVRVFGSNQLGKTVSEATLEDKFRLAVRRLGGRTHKMMPATKGMPDRLVLLPGGRIYLVELKTETGSVSPRQRLWHEQAAEVGTLVHVIYGQAGVADWVAAHTV